MKILFCILILIPALYGCASFDVDRSSAAFDETKYTSDLSECRGGSTTKFIHQTIKMGLAGSLIGAAEGVTHGAIAGDGFEGLLIGAAVGGVLGSGTGAYQAVTEQYEEIDDCLRGKGYTERVEDA